ncbi:hypothetical protein NAPIS_ORF02544 [Vairimorpha apis BRL 01]|uniref:Uncharacterized protein n=1 Tax=Vairimorpha apis BRL 01 TaxID=1037528 RepID=T0KWP9_9MICR|nr:hypothetical protein NAPIS_ORF02544 [Vairimorpha apis BRL 01]
MPLLKHIKKNTLSSLLITTSHNTFLLDYPTTINTDLSLNTLEYNLSLVDTIFISSSDSFGIVFDESEFVCYLSLPVYQQIVFKVEQYFESKSVCGGDVYSGNVYSKNVKKDMNNGDMKSRNVYSGNVKSRKDKNSSKIDSGNDNRHDRNSIRVNRDNNININNIINSFKEKCIFIEFNQCIRFNGCTFTPKPSGMYIGWCMFLFEMNSFSLLYFSCISLCKKICLPVEICESTYVFCSGYEKGDEKCDNLNKNNLNKNNNLNKSDNLNKNNLNKSDNINKNNNLNSNNYISNNSIKNNSNKNISFSNNSINNNINNINNTNINDFNKIIKTSKKQNSI